jgi:hypothetical protein
VTPLDMLLTNHECSHALIAVLEEWPLVLIRTDRHARDMDGFGQVLYFDPPDASPEVRARVYLAGNVIEPSRPSGPDVEKAIRVWASISAPRGWIEQREAEVDEMLTRERRALGALCDELVAAGGVLVGTRAERVIAETRESPGEWSAGA